MHHLDMLTERIEAISTKKVNILTDISILNNLVDIELEEIVGVSSVSALTGPLVPNAGKTIPILVQTKCKLFTVKITYSTRIFIVYSFIDP